MQAGWLSDLTAWIWKAVKTVWQAFADFFSDLFVLFLDKALSA
ncbi:phage coat protein, partial [Xanthomonas fragariae]